ncbi:2-amino-3-carboxymuconate-6-semialdehyde decarboxylase [Ceratocystis lukuohia]|uniref:2-amino-3-carboxymuconate-6-semialdehyde decarboxylase n=1 Tax=Ceratocystis lukuohia TaxID=2019550 RepID=A0ABR4ME38_9PEZI
MATNTSPVVDIHTHMYPPSYLSMLEKRTTIPLVRSFPGANEPRLILLEAEIENLEKAGKDAAVGLPGRPLTSHYASLEQKLHFMNTHKIDISVISLANPWCDFLEPENAAPQTRATNVEFSQMCAAHPGRLYFFATLPLTAPIDQLLEAITELKTLDYCRGVILGTSGLGSGLDDPKILPIFSQLAQNKLPVFLHPHYGLPNEMWGPKASAEYGHVLPLAMGFPMETTIAVTRMFLAGVFDAVPDLQMILAHSGGTLPFLAGRIESCIMHDGYLAATNKTGPGRRSLWTVLREQIYLDAVVYSPVGLKAAVDASGPGRVMFGTDHPFFPPLKTDPQGEWESVSLNAEAIALAASPGAQSAIMGDTAARVLNLTGK